MQIPIYTPGYGRHTFDEAMGFAAIHIKRHHTKDGEHLPLYAVNQDEGDTDNRSTTSDTVSTTPDCLQDTLINPCPWPTSTSQLHRAAIKDKDLYHREQELICQVIGSQFDGIHISDHHHISFSEDASFAATLIASSGGDPVDWTTDLVPGSTLGGVSSAGKQPQLATSIIEIPSTSQPNNEYETATAHVSDALEIEVRSTDGWKRSRNSESKVKKAENQDEAPDLFFWFDPKKYEAYKRTCWKFYSRHNDFFDRSIEYHWKSGHFHDEFGEAAEDAYWRAKMATPDYYAPNDSNYRELCYKMKLTALWSVPQLQVMPKCPDHGTHPVYVSRVKEYRFPELPDKSTRPKKAARSRKMPLPFDNEGDSVHQNTTNNAEYSQLQRTTLASTNQSLVETSESPNIDSIKALSAKVDAHEQQVPAVEEAVRKLRDELQQLRDDNEKLQDRQLALEWCHVARISAVNEPPFIPELFEPEASMESESTGSNSMFSRSPYSEATSHTSHPYSK